MILANDNNLNNTLKKEDDYFMRHKKAKHKKENPVAGKHNNHNNLPDYRFECI